MAQVKMTITGERLMAMYDNEMGVYVTPGDNRPYWASSPNFQDDYAVASAGAIVRQIEKREAVFEDELRTDEGTYEFYVKVR